MITALPTPAYVGYFTVGVPVDKADRHIGRAAEIVERYLYSPGEVVRTELSEDFETFLVLVRFEGRTGHGDLDRAVRNQRERLSSGLYASTEPRYLMAIGPSDD